MWANYNKIFMEIVVQYSKELASETLGGMQRQHWQEQEDRRLAKEAAEEARMQERKAAEEARMQEFLEEMERKKQREAEIEDALLRFGERSNEYLEALID